jgi:hypothetical protein
MAKRVENQSKLTRRFFLQTSTAGAALVTSIGNQSSKANEEPAAANDKLGVAILGGGIRGGVHCEEFVREKGVEVLYIVDPDETMGQRRADAVAARQGRKPAFEREEIAKALDRNNSDFDLCQWQGKVMISYSWGDQVGNEFLAQATYDGTLEEFFAGFFPKGESK